VVGGEEVMDRIAVLGGYLALTIAFDGRVNRTPRFPQV
jgi:hypothetical protein